MTDAPEDEATTQQLTQLAKLKGNLPGGLTKDEIRGEATLVKNGWARYDGARFYFLTDEGDAVLAASNRG